MQERRRRLYVARSQRGVLNDAEVWAELSARGFERLEPGSWEENVKTFAEADIVVGPHGAGLSNVIFSPPGATLIELVPGDRPFPYFYSAASAAGMHYRAVLLSPLTPPGLEYRKLPSDDPQRVDLAALRMVLDEATSLRSS
jgi:capsular polysaccharide biosynthesis protein